MNEAHMYFYGHVIALQKFLIAVSQMRETLTRNGEH